MENPPPPAPITGQRTAPLTQRLATPPTPNPPPPSPPPFVCSALSRRRIQHHEQLRQRGAARCSRLRGGARGHAAAPQPPRPPPFRALLLLFLFCVSFLFSLKKTYPRASAPRQPLSPPPPPRRAGGRPTPSPRSSPPSWCPGGQKGGGWGSGRIRSGEGPGSVSAEGVRRGRLGLGGIQQSFASPAPRCAAPSVPGGPVPP